MALEQSSHLPRLLLVIPQSLPSSTIYIVKPLTELARQNRVIFNVALEDDVAVARLRASDVVLFCRNIEPSSDWILQECIAQNIPTVYDLDDNFWEVPEGLKYTEYHRAPHRLRQLERYLRQVDRVRVYSQPLVERALQFNARVSMVTPCIDMSLVPSIALPRRDDLIRLTYVTGRGASDALISVFADDLARLLEKYSHLQVYWWGEAPDRFKAHPSTQIVGIQRDYDQFLQYLSHEGFDIGLAPLTPSSFNLSKTNTKFRDYGASRIVGIYSDVDVYTACVEHDKTGLLVHNRPGAWFEAMDTLVTDIERRQNIREAAYRYVYDHFRQELVERQWLDLIDEMLEKRRARRTTPGFRPSGPAPAVQIALMSSEPPPPGFIGLGRRRWPGVQVIADPAAPLPLAADVASAVLVEGALDDLPTAPSALLDQRLDPLEALAEIHRICRHAARVSLLAAYSQPPGFDDEAPRRWSPVEPFVYHTKAYAASLAVLAEAAVETPAPSAPVESAPRGLDLRCLTMEFFYRPQDLARPEAEKRQLRHQQAGVCEQVLYHAVAVKRPIAQKELALLAEAPDWVDPTSAPMRRLQDTAEVLKDDLNRAYGRIEELRQELKERERDVIRRDAALSVQQAELNLQMGLARQLAQQMEAYRNRRLIRVIDQALDRVDYAPRIGPAYQHLRDDSLVFFGPLAGFRLRPSANLQAVPCLAYPVRLRRPHLCQVSVAPLIVLYPRAGAVGLQIFAQGRMVVQEEFPAGEIRAETPIEFNFRPLPESAGPLELRFYGRELDVPLRIYEWRARRGQAVRPFCSFQFEASK